MQLIELSDRDFVLSSELNELIFNSDDDLVFVLSIDDIELFYETYTPMNGVISIYGINKYFQNTISQAKLTLDNVEYSFKVIKCEAEIIDDLDTFIDRSFLSLLKGDKITYIDTTEMVHCLTRKTTNVIVESTYKTEDGIYNKESKLIATSVANQINSFEIKPSDLLKDGLTLVNFTVTCGLRKKRFLVDYSAKVRTSFVFKNVFALPESACFIGNQSYELNYVNEFATLNGQYKKLDVSQEKIYTSNTGLLPRMQVEWISNDLLLSKDVVIFKDGELYKAVTITESEVEISEVESSNANIQVKYRLNQQIQYIADFRKYLIRVFSNEFDDTFA